jgi:hypothetical protein
MALVAHSCHEEPNLHTNSLNKLVLFTTIKGVFLNLASTVQRLLRRQIKKNTLYIICDDVIDDI